MSTHTVATEKVKQYMLSFIQEQIAAGNAEEQVLQAWMSNENIDNLDELLTKTKTKAKGAVKKKKKDPTAPKGKKSSFILFGLDERPKISPEDVDKLMADQPNTKTKVAATGKILGLRWSEVDAVVKKHYTDLAVADKARYDKEMEGYVRPAEFDTDDEGSSDESNPKTSARKKAKGGSKKAKGGPKGAKNAFTFFKAEVIPEIKEEGIITVYPEQVREASLRWALLQKDEPDEAQRYKDLAAEDKIRHADELENYSPSEEESDADKKAPKLKKKVTAIPVGDHTLKTLKALTKDELVEIAKEIGAKCTGTKSVISEAILGVTGSSSDEEVEEVEEVEVEMEVSTDEEVCEEGAPAEEIYTLETLMKKKKSELATIAKEYGLKSVKGKKDEVAAAIMEKIENPNSEDATKKRVNGLTAYCTTRRQELQADNDAYEDDDKISAKAMTKKMTDEWRDMDADAREPWEQKAK
jgi:hypothetical protein